MKILRQKSDNLQYIMLGHWVDCLINQVSIMERIFAKNFAKKYDKKLFGTLDAWSMRQSSQGPSNPAYYIEDCRVL